MSHEDRYRHVPPPLPLRKEDDGIIPVRPIWVNYVVLGLVGSLLINLLLMVLYMDVSGRNAELAFNRIQVEEALSDSWKSSMKRAEDAEQRLLETDIKLKEATEHASEIEKTLAETKSQLEQKLTIAIAEIDSANQKAMSAQKQAETAENELSRAKEKAKLAAVPAREPPRFGKLTAEIDQLALSAAPSGRRVQVTLPIRYDPELPEDAKPLHMCVLNTFGIPEFPRDSDVVINHLTDTRGRVRRSEVTLFVPGTIAEFNLDPASLRSRVREQLTGTKYCLRTPVVVTGKIHPQMLIYICAVE